MFFADVLIHKKIPSLDHAFTYEIPPELVGLVRPGSAVRAPFGHGSATGLVLAVKEEAGVEHTRYLDGLLHDEFVFPADLMELAGFIAAYYLNTTSAVLGAMLPRGVNVFGKLQPAKTEELLTVADWQQPLRGEKQKALLALVCERGALTTEAARRELGVSAATVRNLCEKGVLRSEIRTVRRYSYEQTQTVDSFPTLSAEQQHALAVIRARAGESKPFLLRGVTGSGKTEIYLHLVGEALARGEQAIVLLPEIALTPQFVALFERRFGGQIALMHSRLSEGERRDAWYSARDGSARVILGARSAIFAPCCCLGLIIVDEEHEDSYEQSNSPRFDARTVAEERARQSGALLLLGSATPRLETYHKARNGDYILVELKHRFGHAPLPAVETVDMRAELKAGHTEILSRSLLAAMADNLAAGKQTLLYLNRLGFHTFVSCRDCGYTATCPHCGVSLVQHRAAQVLRCHRCNYEEPIPARCPQCGSDRIRYFGLGTEGLEAAVRRRFPTARIDRLDSDSTRKKGSFDAIYDRVQRGETQILIGTRLIAKGWDFPNVTLAGILAADLTLNFPDFRAVERTFQCITQVAGRCGRGPAGGRVILQTYRPEDEVIALGGRQDYEGFFDWELARREYYGYPPFAHLVRIGLTAKRGRLDAETLRPLAALFRTQDAACALFGPAPAVYRYHSGEERWQITLMGPKLEPLRAAAKKGISRLDSEITWSKELKISAEIDPLNIL